MKRVLLLLLATILLLMPLAGCKGGKKPVDTTESTQNNDDPNSKYDENGFLKDDLPSDMNFDDDIKILHWTEHQIGEFNPPEDSKDTIDKSIIQRDQKAADRLGVTFKWTGAKGHWSSMNSFISKVMTAYQGGEEDRYDLIGVYSQTAAALAPKGLVLNLTDIEYLDFEKPWWPESLLENSMVADKLWFVSGDICTSFTSELMDVTFNKSKFPDLNLYDIVCRNEILITVIII